MAYVCIYVYTNVHACIFVYTHIIHIYWMSRCVVCLFVRWKCSCMDSFFAFSMRAKDSRPAPSGTDLGGNKNF